MSNRSGFYTFPRRPLRRGKYKEPGKTTLPGFEDNPKLSDSPTYSCWELVAVSLRL